MVPTVTRRPRMHGFPPITRGSSLILISSGIVIPMRLWYKRFPRDSTTAERRSHKCKGVDRRR